MMRFEEWRNIFGFKGVIMFLYSEFCYFVYSWFYTEARSTLGNDKDIGNGKNIYKYIYTYKKYVTNVKWKDVVFYDPKRI